MNSTIRRVLLIDDRADDTGWLVAFLESRGYDIHQITNEKAGREVLEQVRTALNERQKPYSMAIIDVMIPVMDIWELVETDQRFFEDSSMSGVRLCRLARQDLAITKEELPIVSLTARSDDEEVKAAFEELGIPLFSRVPQNEVEDIRRYLEAVLPKAEEG